MLTHAITDSRSWTAASIDAAPAWHYPLPDACQAAFAQLRGTTQPLPALRLPDAARAEVARSLQEVRVALEAGRGFAIVNGPPGERLGDADAALLYWIVGQGLGQPVAQNVQGTMLYDVRDTGEDLSKGARFSVTNYESSFHTDNSFGTEVVDYVGLLCLRVAKSGGRSQVLSGYALHNALLAEHPEALATLYQPFHVDRRGGVRAGETPTIPFPIFQRTDDEVLVRYLRHWIEAGHEKIGQPLSPSQTAALDVLDECLRRRDLRVEFDLQPGDMYFTNNRWILHNRTAFEDHPEQERRRHLVRLWLRKSGWA